MASAISIGNVLPATASLASGNIKKAVLDLAFRDSCLWMQDSTLLFTSIASKISIPFPLLGFSFQTPESFTIAKYSYAKYPYLNKVAVANSFLKEVCPIEITALRPITRTNPLVLNYVLNWQGIKNYVERYADKGGLWSLNTMWGLYTDLALTELSAERDSDKDQMGGVKFRFSFEKLNFDNVSSVGNVVSSLCSKLGG